MIVRLRWESFKFRHLPHRLYELDAEQCDRDRPLFGPIWRFMGKETRRWARAW